MEKFYSLFDISTLAKVYLQRIVMQAEKGYVFMFVVHLMPSIHVLTHLKPCIFLYQGLLWEPSLIFCMCTSSSGVQNLGKYLS